MVVRLAQAGCSVVTSFRCAHGHEWSMTVMPKLCPMCGTTSFTALSAPEEFAAGRGRLEPDRTLWELIDSFVPRLRLQGESGEFKESATGSTPSAMPPLLLLVRSGRIRVRGEMSAL